MVDEYMTANALGHGVYLVGWYPCDAWSDKDRRKRDTPRDPLDGIRAQCFFEKILLSRSVISVTSSSLK